MPLLTKTPEMPEKTILGWTRQDTIDTARIRIERSWRVLLRADDAENFIGELRTLTGFALLSPADVDELVAYARQLGSAEKTSVYRANFREAQAFIRMEARTMVEGEIRGRLLELGLDEDDRNHLVALAAKLRSDLTLQL